MSVEDGAGALATRAAGGQVPMRPTRTAPSRANPDVSDGAAAFAKRTVTTDGDSYAGTAPIAPEPAAQRSGATPFGAVDSQTGVAGAGTRLSGAGRPTSVELSQQYTRAAFDFAVMLCCAVMMIVLAKIMAKLHGGNACPFGLNPYDGSSMGTAEQCHVVIVFGLIVLIIAGFFLVVELTFMYIGQVPRKSFWAILELAMFTLCLLFMIGVAAMIELEFKNLCSAFLSNGQQRHHAYSGCEDAMDTVAKYDGNNQRLESDARGLGSLYENLTTLQNTGWATVVILLLACILLLYRFWQHRIAARAATAVPSKTEYLRPPGAPPSDAQEAAPPPLSDDDALNTKLLVR